MKLNALYSTLALAGLILFAACEKSQQTTTMPPAPSVNAGPDQTVMLPVDSIVLTGSAHDSVSRITGYIWSEVAGPNAALIVTDGAAKTIVTGLVPGSYIFQLMAVDSLGQTGVDTVSVMCVAGPNMHTVVLHTFFPGSSTPYEYTYFGNATENLGGTVIELLAETWTVNGVLLNGRSYMKFNTSPIPAGASIQSATLTLLSDTLPDNGDLVHANYGVTNDFWLRRTTSSWNSTTDYYNNPPSTDTVGEVHVPQTNQPFLDLNLNITQMFASQLADGNYGMEMRLNTEQLYNSRIFCSSTYSDTTRRPYLTVTYTTQ